MTYDIRLRRHLDVTPTSPSTVGSTPTNADAGTRATKSSGSSRPPPTCESAARYFVRWGPTPERVYQEDGIFEAVESPHRLVYTSRFTPISADEGAPVDLRVTVTFQSDSDGTLIELVESGYPTIEV